MSKSERLTTDFQSLFGAPPEVISAAPGRVNLIGEHIDYSNGFVLPFAISANTFCALRSRPDDVVRIASRQRSCEIFEMTLDALKPMTGPDWTRYMLGVIWSLEIKNGLDILVDSEVPVGSGLSSSAALECSIATALNHRFQLNKSPAQLARLTQRAENEYVGVPCGIMDQSISLMGKSGRALLLDCRDLSTRDVRVDFASAGLKLLIVDTRAHHALTDGGYAERRAQCEAVAKSLGVESMRDLTFEELKSSEPDLNSIAFRRARHAVTEIARVIEAVGALEENNFTHFGELLNQSHRSLRDDYNVSSPELDLVVNVALREGALGARMVGGGFGGSAIALIKEADAGRICQMLEKEFEVAGFGTPKFFDSLPSEGARILS